MKNEFSDNECLYPYYNRFCKILKLSTIFLMSNTYVKNINATNSRILLTLNLYSFIIIFTDFNLRRYKRNLMLE